MSICGLERETRENEGEKSWTFFLSNDGGENEFFIIFYFALSLFFTSPRPGRHGRRHGQRFSFDPWR